MLCKANPAACRLQVFGVNAHSPCGGMRMGVPLRKSVPAGFCRGKTCPERSLSRDLGELFFRKRLLLKDISRLQRKQGAALKSGREKKTRCLPFGSPSAVGGSPLPAGVQPVLGPRVYGCRWAREWRLASLSSC